MLIHQLPPKPDYLRVKVRRRLTGLGAVPLKNTVYVLPMSEAALEDFQWLRQDIRAEQGDATIVAARLLGGLTDEELRAQFRSASETEYEGLLADIRATGGDAGAGDLERLRRQLEAIEARDHFGAPGRAVAKEALHQLEVASGARESAAPAGPLPARPVSATWVTRKGVFVDRMASAWLIRRFIDPAARFRFVPPQGYRPDPGEIRFDMFEGEFTHADGGCTFETLLRRFALADEALAALGEIVHDIDCKDGKFARPEEEWVTTMLRGVTATHAADADRIDAAMPLFDALYASLREAGGTG